jgi:adenylate cyclase
MVKGKRSVPFSISILTLMALIVVPLASTLLWLGWRAVDKLEQRDGATRLAALDDAVSVFLTNDLHTIVSVGLTLAEVTSFTSQAGPAADDDRGRHLVAVLQQHPVLAAAFAGYPDGHFVFAGHMASFSADQRVEYGAPRGDPTIVRIIDGEGAARRETWWFQSADGSRSAVKERHSDYDPRTRPWYVEPLKLGAPALTEPYIFAQSDEPGISAGIPMRPGGMIGFDFTLGTLSRLLGRYRVTPNSIIMASTDTSDIFIESEPCADSAYVCLPGDTAARAALKRAVLETRTSDRSVAHEVEVAGRPYKLIVHRIPHTLGKNFVIGAIVPESELSVASSILLEHAAVTASIAIGLAVLAVLAVSLLLSRSMARITGKTERIRNLDFSDRVPVVSRIREVLRLSNAVEQMREGLEVFGRYVSKDLVRQIMRSPQSTGVGGERRELTVLFSDIEGFSLISETMEPELLTSRLSRYFEALGAPISANRGMIDKYIGDSIMAFWNAPEPDDDHIANACRATLQAAAAGRRLAEKWHARGRPVFRTRFGLHAGPAVVGNVGARERINYTLVGAVANQASRLEGLNKVYGTEILASGAVVEATADRFVWRHIDRIVAAGTTEMLDIHEPLGERSAEAEHAPFLAQWKAGRAAYVDGCFDAAIVCFRAAQALRPHDAPCRLFIERCTGLSRDGLPAGWDAAWRFDKK